MASWNDQKPRIATEKDVKGSWGCGKNGKFFRCYFCGHKFKVGDQWRWVYSNGTTGAFGNPIVCKNCDGEDVLDRWKAKHDEFKEDKWWWFRKTFCSN
jgi:hypothetical protein